MTFQSDMVLLNFVLKHRLFVRGKQNRISEGADCVASQAICRAMPQHYNYFQC